ncbi:MAG: nucleotidyl transferase AbiEii/AbiGii toxin family protein [Candidatus Levyibacteriota bacterium]
MHLHTDILPQTTATVLEKIKESSIIKDFYLSGGTALTLQLGHRESEDLDFFIEKQFQPEILQQHLLSYGQLENVEISEGTLNLFLDKVKLQFLHYPYHLLEEPMAWNGIHLSSMIDIACTKLITISQRGSKKDFIDMYVILQSISLEYLFKKLDEKYKSIHYSTPHILKSLVYFDDADPQPMPRMHIPLAWETVKDFTVEEVKKIIF